MTDQEQVARTARRKSEDAYLRAHGWSGGIGNWQHPWLPGHFTKWLAMLETKQNPKIQGYKTIS